MWMFTFRLPVFSRFGAADYLLYLCALYYKFMIVPPLHQLYDFFVYPQEIDGAENLRLSSLENYLLNAAGLAAEENGFGSVEMIHQGVTWVLSRLAMEMHALPMQYERFSIETWVEDYGRLLTTRHFRVYDKQENLIGHACSLWTLIDFNTRRLVNLQSRPDLARFASGEVGGIAKPDKIAEYAEAVSVGKHTVSYSDIDYNNHTNSMKYVDWMLDTLSLDTLYNRLVRRFDINYLHEALYGETVGIYRADIPEGVFFDLKNPDGLSLCRARLQFK